MKHFNIWNLSLLLPSNSQGPLCIRTWIVISFSPLEKSTYPKPEQRYSVTMRISLGCSTHLKEMRSSSILALPSAAMDMISHATPYRKAAADELKRKYRAEFDTTGIFILHTNFP